MGRVGCAPARHHRQGLVRDSAAVLAFDAFWRQAVHCVYDPQLGADVVKLLQGPMDLVLDQRPTATGFYDGWYGRLSDVVRAALRLGPRMRATTCGGGTAIGCRRVLRAAFTAAVAGLVRQYGGNPATWHKPALCAASDVDCDANNAITAGALDTPPQPFENRGTFHQAVEVYP